MFIDIREAVALSGRHANTIKRWGRMGKFKWAKPAGTRNAPWSIDRESFIACMRDEPDHPHHEDGVAVKARVTLALRLISALAASRTMA
jgi:hypothetical protein